MKRIAMIGLSLLLCLLAGAALAGPSNQEEWDLYCVHKSNSCTLYDVVVKEVENGSYDENGATQTDLTYVYSAVGSLPAGRSVKPTGEKAGDKVEIAYWEGGRRYAFVDSGSYEGSSFSVKVNGTSYRFPTMASSNDVLLRRSIMLRYPGADAEKIIQAYYGGGVSEDDGTEEDGEGSSGSSAKKKAVVSDRMNPVFRWTDENGQEQVVSVVTLGMVDTVIRVNGEEKTVRTKELTWDHKVTKENQRLAIINAKRTGEATMHAKAKAKSDVLKKCDTNRIVVVLKVGKTYTRILYKGVEGFVLTSALDFYPIGGVTEKDEAPLPGWVSYKGKVKSRQSINIRQNGKNGSRIVDEIRAGTPLWVFKTEGKWAEVEVAGYRAWILKEYVTMDDSYVPENEPAAEDEAA